MIARLLDNYNCSNCRMPQWEAREQCNFCGAIFSNYEEMLIKEVENMSLYKQKQKTPSIMEELNRLRGMETQDPWSVIIHIEPQDVANAKIWCDRNNVHMQESHVTDGKIFYHLYI